MIIESRQKHIVASGTYRHRQGAPHGDNSLSGLNHDGKKGKKPLTWLSMFISETGKYSTHSVSPLPETAAERLVETPPAPVIRLFNNLVVSPSASPSATADVQKNSFLETRTSSEIARDRLFRFAADAEITRIETVCRFRSVWPKFSEKNCPKKADACTATTSEMMTKRTYCERVTLQRWSSGSLH